MKGMSAGKPIKSSSNVKTLGSKKGGKKLGKKK